MEQPPSPATDPAASGAAPTAATQPPQAQAGVAGTPGQEPAKPVRRWTAPPKQMRRLDKFGWWLVVVSTTAVVVLGLFILLGKASFIEVNPGPVVLGQAYLDNEDNFSIRPPVNWTVDDHFPDASVAITGPQEHGMSPLILVALEIAPGRLESYLEEHKRRLQRQDPSVKWLSEDEVWIDGCRATRLEFECAVEDRQGGMAPVRALQYVFDCKPRYYRVTCFVAASLYEKYRSKFEATAGSFARQPLVVPFPQPVNDRN